MRILWTSTPMEGVFLPFVRREPLRRGPRRREARDPDPATWCRVSYGPQRQRAIASIASPCRSSALGCAPASSTSASRRRRRVTRRGVTTQQRVEPSRCGGEWSSPSRFVVAQGRCALCWRANGVARTTASAVNPFECHR
jgi:hypothetical protein